MYMYMYVYMYSFMYLLCRYIYVERDVCVYIYNLACRVYLQENEGRSLTLPNLLSANAVYVYTYMCVNIYIYVCMYRFTYLCMYIYRERERDVHICIYMYVYVCMYNLFSSSLFAGE